MLISILGGRSLLLFLYPLPCNDLHIHYKASKVLVCLEKQDWSLTEEEEKLPKYQASDVQLFFPNIFYAVAYREKRGSDEYCMVYKFQEVKNDLYI